MDTINSGIFADLFGVYYDRTVINVIAVLSSIIINANMPKDN
jgi:hypothetical protein